MNITKLLVANNFVAEQFLKDFCDEFQCDRNDALERVRHGYCFRDANGNSPANGHSVVLCFVFDEDAVRRATYRLVQRPGFFGWVETGE